MQQHFFLETDDLVDKFDESGKIGVDEVICENGTCFTADTLISTQYGMKRIDEIKPGDKVYSFDEKTKEISLKSVLQVYEKESSELVHITVGDSVINATPTHPFYVPVKGWIAACELQAGDVLYTVNGEYVVVEQVQHEILEEPIKVYNFSVADNHTYFVSDFNVCVHNTCGYNYKKFDNWDDMKKAYEGTFTKFIKQNKPLYSPDVKKWFDKGGVIEIENVNGQQIWTYISSNGNAVPYIDGYIKFPDSYLYPEVNQVNIGAFTGDRRKDTDMLLVILEEEYGLTEIPSGYVVHHHTENGILQLVDEAVHKEFTHIGGHSLHSNGG